MHNLGRQFNGRGALWTCRHPPATTTSYTPFPILTPMNDDEWTGSGPSNIGRYQTPSLCCSGRQCQNESSDQANIQSSSLAGHGKLHVSIWAMISADGEASHGWSVNSLQRRWWPVGAA